MKFTCDGLFFERGVGETVGGMQFWPVGAVTGLRLTGFGSSTSLFVQILSRLPQCCGSFGRRLSVINRGR